MSRCPKHDQNVCTPGHRVACFYPESPCHADMVEMRESRSRITREQMFLGMADLLALRSTCLRGNVGALIVVDNRPAGGGYNGAPSGQPQCTEVGCEPLVFPGETLGDLEMRGRVDVRLGTHGCQRIIHAEANAIAWAARHGVRTTGADLYCTHSPCVNCAKLIIAAKFGKFVYKKSYRAERLDLLEAAGIEVVKWG